MEHLDGVAMGVKQKLLECKFEDSEKEEQFTSGIRVVLLLLDATYSLLLTKY
jgi:hypothetical protein